MYDPSSSRRYLTDSMILRNQDRTKRLKDAKSEAHKEIEEYRQQKEEEFRKFEAEVRHLHTTRTGITVPQPRIWPNANLLLSIALERVQKGRRRRKQGRRSQTGGDQGGRRQAGRQGRRGSALFIGERET